MKKLLLLFAIGLLGSSSYAQIKYSSLFNTSPSSTYFQASSLDELFAMGNNGMLFYTDKESQGWKNPSSIITKSTNNSTVNGMGKTIIIPVSEGIDFELLRSIDGGKTFESILSSEFAYHFFYHTSFLTEQKFFLSGMKGLQKPWLTKTDDGGNTWTDIGTPEGSTGLRTVNFISEDVGFVYDLNGKWYKTVDGGANWTEFTTFPANTKFQFSSEEKGIAVGGNSLYETTDGGQTWNQTSLTGISAAKIVKGDTMIAESSTQRKFYYSTDRFQTFTEKVFPFNQNPIGIQVINDSTFIGKNTKFMKTTDRGETWTNLDLQENPMFYPTVFTWVNDSLGYATSSDSVYKTTKGGYEWIAIGKSPTKVNIYENIISFGDSEHGVAFTNTWNESFITKDGGLTWDYIEHSFKGDVKQLKMISASKGWLVGNSGLLAQTDDNGETWINLNDRLPDNLKDNGLQSIDFISESKGIIGGSHGWIGLTSDGGETWTAKQITNYNDIEIVHIFTEQDMSAMHSSGVFSSSDGGENWEFTAVQVAGNSSLEVESSSFLNEKVGAFLAANSLVYTIDAGKTWTVEFAPAKNTLPKGLHLTKNGKGVLYSDGFIGFESEALATSVEDEKSLTVRDFALEQNFPNPFNPSTTISFSLKHFDSVNLSIYSIDGRLVSTLISNKNLSSGTHQIQFDAKSLASGVYFYQLRTSQGISTRKMTLIK